MRALRGLALATAYLAGPAFGLGTDIQYTEDALADLVKWEDLPGWSAVSAAAPNMFAGYVEVDASRGKKIFYWFFESQQDAAQDPVVMWTNGGPGCSGFLGLLAEHGPIQVRDHGNSLVANEFSWNKLANMLYIETPSGVGFSYSDTESDYSTGDKQTALDNHKLLQGFIERFPHLAENALYITSESYGGHYMPTLALTIVEQNALVAAGEASGPVLNFMGLAVGNPYTDANSNREATYESFWGKQIIPKAAYDEYVRDCRGREYTRQCARLEQRMDNYVGHLNPYALDFPVCLSSDAKDVAAQAGRAQRTWLMDHLHSHRLANGYATEDGLGDAEFSHSMLRDEYEPCAEDWSALYLNRADVKEALHAKGSITWESCSSKVMYSDKDVATSMMPYYNKLIDGGHKLRILVFSGDDDSVCATQGTQWWIYDLGYQPKTLWDTWEVAGQVAGYVTKFDGLTFVTVHDAGHEVPAYQPERAFQLFKNFLDGTWFQ